MMTKHDLMGFPLGQLIGGILGRPKVCLKDMEQGGVIPKYSRIGLVGHLGKLVPVIELGLSNSNQLGLEQPPC
jgi:hypothetical protein